MFEARVGSWLLMKSLCADEPKPFCLDCLRRKVPSNWGASVSPFIESSPEWLPGAVGQGRAPDRPWTRQPHTPNRYRGPSIGHNRHDDSGSTSGRSLLFALTALLG